MLNVLYFLLLLMLSPSSFSGSPESNVSLMYSGFKLLLPEGPLVIGSTGGSDNFLILKYSDEPGKKYIAFTKMNKDSGVDYGCALSVFIKDAFLGNKESTCNKVELQSFDKVFLEAKDNGVLESSGHAVYYTVSETDAFLFFVASTGEVIKIDTDHIGLSGLKNIVGEYLD